MKQTKLCLYLSAALLTAALGSAQTIKKTPIKPMSVQGKDMYVSYCAACHGVDGSGNGPAASALKMAPADLTKLAQSHDGKYPGLRVAESIREGGGIAAHGTSDMPVWGSLLGSVCSSRAEVDLRVKNLTDYIKTLQK